MRLAAAARMAQSDDVFDIGDRTIFQLRSQEFTPDEEFGTMMIRAPRGDETMIVTPVSDAPRPEERVAELERKLDLAFRHISALRQRIDSMDAMLARFLSRD